MGRAGRVLIGAGGMRVAGRSVQGTQATGSSGSTALVHPPSAVAAAATYREADDVAGQLGNRRVVAVHRRHLRLAGRRGGGGGGQQQARGSSQHAWEGLATGAAATGPMCGWGEKDLACLRWSLAVPTCEHALELACKCCSHTQLLLYKAQYAAIFKTAHPAQCEGAPDVGSSTTIACYDCK